MGAKKITWALGTIPFNFPIEYTTENRGVSLLCLRRSLSQQIIYMNIIIECPSQTS